VTNSSLTCHVPSAARAASLSSRRNEHAGGTGFALIAVAAWLIFLD